ncbi:MAG TPA: hypothetical protein VJ994_07550 [Paracoccaceae bacterium]|nr:hypothetical protein [Paracoccaceae bacterium]
MAENGAGDLPPAGRPAGRPSGPPAAAMRAPCQAEKGAGTIGHLGGGGSPPPGGGKSRHGWGFGSCDRSGGGRMFGVELYGRVRLAVFRDGLSHRQAARRFGIDRGTVAKMASHREPPGYRRPVPVRRPKLEAHVGFIDEILRSDLEAPRRQRHTVRRLFERLRDERGFDGGCTTVRDAVRPRRRTPKEAFVPLAHPPGHARADFGEAWAVIDGVKRKVRFFVMVALGRAIGSSDNGDAAKRRDLHQGASEALPRASRRDPAKGGPNAGACHETVPAVARERASHFAALGGICRAPISSGRRRRPPSAPREK